jgi:hypothetical protein
MSEKSQTRIVTNPYEKVETLTTDMREAMAGPDRGRDFFEGLRIRAKANAWNLSPTDAQSNAELLMRNLVVAADAIGVKKTKEAIGTTYDEIINVASGLTGQAMPDTEAGWSSAMAELQHGMNSYRLQFGEDSEPGDRAQLIDSLMYANGQLLTGETRDAIAINGNLDYYMQKVVGAAVTIEAQSQPAN